MSAPQQVLPMPAAGMSYNFSLPSDIRPIRLSMPLYSHFIVSEAHRKAFPLETRLDSGTAMCMVHICDGEVFNQSKQDNQ
jgi:hypothetical protein